MIQYIYFVKCPNCEDEHFDFFDDAKGFALGCLSKKPIITQTEVCRNDFGECTDSSDLGTVWSWEDECKDCQEPAAESTFTKDEIAADYEPDTDPEFADDDSDFRFVNDMTESLNGADLDEIKKLCDEIGIVTMYDLHSFMKETGATDETLVAKLREYRAELGLDFKIKESRKPIMEGYDVNFEISGFEYSIEDEFEDDGVKGYNLVYSKNGTDIVEVEVWEEDSPVTVNKNLYAPHLMSTLYDSFDSFAADLSYKASKYIKESRKPVPEGMTIEQLVEEMEENEDEVECTWCNDLFPKDMCRKEVNLGWLCSRCADGIMSRGEKLAFVENNYWDFLDEEVGPRDPFDHHDPDYDEDEAADFIANEIDRARDERYDDALEEAFDGNAKVDLEYDEITITVYRNSRYDDNWGEHDYTGSYTYAVSKYDIANAIWEEYLTEEDVADVPGGLETLEDNDAWYSFLETHFDALFDKYYDSLLEYFRDAAAEEFQDNFDYDNYDDGYDPDAEYERWRDEQDGF